MKDVWNICPVCGSRTIVAESPEEFDGTLSQYCWCEECGAKFENIYNFAQQVVWEKEVE